MKRIFGILVVLILLVGCLFVLPTEAQAASTDVTVKTAQTDTSAAANYGILCQVNFEKLYSYIEQNGEANSDGNKYVLLERSTSSGPLKLYLINIGTDIKIRSAIDASSYDIFTEIVLNKTSSQIETQNEIRLYRQESTDLVNNTLIIDRSVHTFDSSSYTAKNCGRYLSKDAASQLLSLGIQLLCVQADEYIYDNLDFGLNGLGFERYYYGGSICETHEEGAWSRSNDDMHYRTCSVCHITTCGDHDWYISNTGNNIETCYDCECVRSAYRTGAPKLVEVTQTTVQLQQYETYEYSMDGVSWQKSAKFTGLSLNTTYKFYQRVAETEMFYAGEKSEALVVTTLPKADCLNKAEKPILVNASHNSISLLKIEGYEYKIDNGEWQDSPVFDYVFWTETYTVYQRIKETSTHKASASSEGLVVELDMQPSVAFCQGLLSDYIDIYGTTQSNGNKRVRVLVSSTYIYLENTSNGIYCSFSTGSSSGTTLKYYFGFYLTPTSKYVDPTMLVEGYYNSSLVSTTTLTASVDRTTYTNSSNIQIDGYADGSNFQRLYNSHMQLLCTAMHIFLLEEVGCGIGGVGFLAFSGEGDGEFYCDAALNHQLGNKVLKYGYVATCERQGYTGDYCCSYCGEIIEKGQTIAALGGHKYTKVCDKDCDTCGEERIVTHTYTGVCDEICDVCGCIQITGTEHTFNAEGVCTACGIRQTGWQLIGNVWYYLADGGVVQTGWQLIGNVWYYFNANGAMVTGDVIIDGVMNSFAPSGAWLGYAASGWKWANGTWYYLADGGVVQTGWQFIGGTWYFMDASGAMQTGWQLIGDVWYYFYSGGAMVTGDVIIDGAMSSFAPSGAWLGYAASGWKWANGTWYYLADGGVVQTGWQLVYGTWYYMDASGAMQTGWQFIGDVWYYFNDGGAMVTGDVIIDGAMSSFAPSGAWLGYAASGWKWANGSWYYLADGGVVQTGWQLVYGTWYYMDASGAMQTGWQLVYGTWYYMDASGAMVTGWLDLGGTWYYLTAGGAMATDWQYIDGVWYNFNSSGVWIGY